MARLKKGDFFGERALLTLDFRAATVRAETNLEVLEITKHQFDEMGLREELDFRGRKAILVEQLVALKEPTEKTPQEIKFIMDSVAKNENLSQFLDLKKLPHFADPAWREDVPAGHVVIRQDDTEADYFYVVQSGELNVFKDDKITGHLSKGACFGELSLLFSAPRTATVRSSKPCQLWVLPRGWIKSAAQASAQTASKKQMVYLNHVKLFDVLLQAEKAVIAPLLNEVDFVSKDKILGFGEEEASMYILVKGSARIEDDDGVREVTAGLSENMSSMAVHCFGERALFGPGHSSERSVKISSPHATCYRLDGVDFQAIFGKYDDILRQSERGIDFVGIDMDLEKADVSSLLSMRKKELRRVSFLRPGQFGNLELWCHTITGDPYMVKALSKGYVVEQGLQEKVMQEKDIMMKLDHSFIVKLLQTFQGKQMLYFLMEPALGGDLYTCYLKQSLHGSNSHALFYSASMLLALDHMHQKKVAYRDLKPENVLLGATGYVKLMEFSLAKVVVGRTYTIVGTPEYLAPEIIGVTGHNQAADWWSFGIFIFELLAGKTPFEGINPMQTFGKTLAGLDKVAFPSKVTPAAQRLIQDLLKRSPAFRLPMKPGGVANVKEADWFQEFDWRALMTQTMVPPFIPDIRGKTDTSNFPTGTDAVKAPVVELKEDDGNFDNFASGA
ncbi:unnamed protein product [Effrenium voratum]|nr:unnamed protein product [Effrenium voratum]